MDSNKSIPLICGTLTFGVWGLEPRAPYTGYPIYSDWLTLYLIYFLRLQIIADQNIFPISSCLLKDAPGSISPRVIRLSLAIIFRSHSIKWGESPVDRPPDLFIQRSMGS
jgi:hypothetical protein